LNLLHHFLQKEYEVWFVPVGLFPLEESIATQQRVELLAEGVGLEDASAGSAVVADAVVGVAEEAKEGLFDGSTGERQAGQELVEGSVELVEFGDEGQQFGQRLQVVRYLLECEG
jgi:hypothetical protein